MSKRLQAVLSDEVFEKLRDISMKKNTTDPNGNMNITMTLTVTIADFHSKLFPEYIGVQRKRNEISPEEIAERKIALEAAKEQARLSNERDRNVALCQILDHSEVITVDGREYCQYPLYTMSSPHVVEESIVKEPLGLLNEELVSLQYRDIYGRSGQEAKKLIDKVKQAQERRKLKSITPFPKAPGRNRASQ